MPEKKIMPLYLHMPANEYTMMKMFAAKNGITLQKLVRSSLVYYMKEVQKVQKSN